MTAKTLGELAPELKAGDRVALTGVIQGVVVHTAADHAWIEWDSGQHEVMAIADLERIP